MYPPHTLTHHPMHIPLIQVQWGDLWPGWYAGNRRRFAVLDPDSKEARLRNQAAREASEAAERAGIEAAVRSYGFDDESSGSGGGGEKGVGDTPPPRP